jgi:hypothetical protein
MYSLKNNLNQSNTSLIVYYRVESWISCRTTNQMEQPKFWEKTFNNLKVYIKPHCQKVKEWGTCAIK